MLSIIKQRVAGFRKELATVRRTADEMLQQHGDGVWKRLAELEASAWKRSAYREFLFWKLTGEYVRDLTKRSK